MIYLFLCELYPADTVDKPISRQRKQMSNVYHTIKLKMICVNFCIQLKQNKYFFFYKILNIIYKYLFEIISFVYINIYIYFLLIIQMLFKMNTSVLECL